MAGNQLPRRGERRKEPPYPSGIDGACPMSSDFELGSDDKTIGLRQERGDIRRRHPRTENHGQTRGAFHFAHIVRLRGVACHRTSNDDGIAAHELDRMGRFADADIGRNGV
jgi:hypothetical protein